MEADKVVSLAKKYDCPSISITYNEPIIWLEYVLDVAKIAKREGLGVVLVTNGYISIEALDQVAPYITAVNVDIKGFTEEFYRKYCKGELNPVLDATVYMHERGIHVETTNLIIPDLNDNLDDIRRMCKWHIENLGENTPLHISRFFPHYKMAYKSPTSIKMLVKAREIALEEGIKFVYVGNLPGNEGEHTYCPSCGEMVIKRFGFSIESWGLDEEMRCKNCGERIPIVGKYHGGRGRFYFF